MKLFSLIAFRRMALCALWPQRSIPRLDHGIWPETSGQGVGFVEAFLGREGKGNCFDWPKCYCSFESAGLFSLFKRSWVFISNTHSPEMTRSVLTANKRQRTRCLATSETHAHICIRPHSVWETRNLMYFLFIFLSSKCIKMKYVSVFLLKSI